MPRRRLLLPPSRATAWFYDTLPRVLAVGEPNRVILDSLVVWRVLVGDLQVAEGKGRVVKISTN